jgi:outer membrane protein insertion porin family
MSTRVVTLAALVALWAASVVPIGAQTPAPGQTPTPAPGQTPAAAPAQPTVRPRICDQDVPPPPSLPPAGSGPVVYFIAPCFESQGGASVIDPETYLYYIQLKPSQPSQGNWTPYDEAAEKVIHDDFLRLWNTNFLDNLWIEKEEYIFTNGVVGELITFHMEERQRVKIVDYVGTKEIETAKVNERLKDAMSEIRLDTFIDPGLVRKVSGIVRDMLKEKGFQNAEVTPEIQAMPGGPKIVHLTFHMSEGPKVKIRKIVFTGNKAISSRTLKRKMKDNKELWFLSFITSRGTFQETKFDEDADKMMAYYRELGYIRANVGVPEQKLLSDSSDKKTRFIELRIPITEGRRYKVGDVEFVGNTVVKTEFLKPLFGLKAGEFYNEKSVRKGLEKAREVYGGAGYWEFTGFPDYKFRDDPSTGGDTEAPQALAALPGTLPAVVDVTMRLQEGERYFVNRITFVGNSTTHDSVIRRNMNLVEGYNFDTNALKNSIKRINQLGYFKPLEEGKGVDLTKTPNETGKVDVRVKLEEQNRNQISFGAGVSQFEGVFGQLSFQTSNFLGRGESLTVSMQAGSLAQNYTLGFTEPFLFDRNMTGGIQIFKQEIHYLNQFTQTTTGGNVTFGVPVGRGFTRFFTNYSYQRVRVNDINTIYTDPTVLRRNPFLSDSLLIGQGGERIISKITPSIVHNTVDNPIFPTSGVRWTLSNDFAGIGGNVKYFKPTVEGVYFWRQNARMSLGFHGDLQYIHQFENSLSLPIFEKLFLGGEYSVRGFDIRSIGPSDPVTGLVLGGDKSLLFNVEQSIIVAGPVRAILFYDAGQVKGPGEKFSIWEDIREQIVPPGPLLIDPRAGVQLVDPSLTPQFFTAGRRSAFKTSTGVEVRFFMPVLNVPFRLIFYYDPQRGGVLDNNLQPQQAYGFRFAVGSTF